MLRELGGMVAAVREEGEERARIAEGRAEKAEERIAALEARMEGAEGGHERLHQSIEGTRGTIHDMGADTESRLVKFAADLADGNEVRERLGMASQEALGLASRAMEASETGARAMEAVTDVSGELQGLRDRIEGFLGDLSGSGSGSGSSKGPHRRQVDGDREGNTENVSADTDCGSTVGLASLVGRLQSVEKVVETMGG